MKISINWLREYVDLSDITNAELIKRLTLSTAEIEEVTEYGKDIVGVVVGQILSAVRAENSNKLSLLKVTDGKQTYDVVCGAPNCKEGMLVAFAKAGARLGELTLTEAKIAGHKSQGMCLSEHELSISDDHDGIIEVQAGTKLGTDIKQVYALEDTVFEVDNKSLTNRPDLWCHYGFAREAAAIFGKKLKSVTTKDLSQYKDLPKLDIKIEDAQKCYRYCGIRLDNITNNKTPIDIKLKLLRAGMRSLNLIADLTNYVMLELGQPMHAFDGDKVQNIVVKTFEKGLEFTTLDGEIRQLNKDALMICSGNNPVAIAGIMGGLDSEITAQTSSILLESATFNATSIRRTSGALSLRSEASQRYEKSLDPLLAPLAAQRFVALLTQIDSNASVCSSLSDSYVYQYPSRTIEIDAKYIDDYCGIQIGEQKIVNILENLGFEVTRANNKLLVKVPSYRATKDISIAADLVEEVARIYGYDNIAPKAVEGKVEFIAQEKEYLLEYQTKVLLAQTFGLSEVHTYLWNDVQANKNLGIKTKGYVKVLNSTVKDNDELRSELLPTLIKAVDENKNSQTTQRMFEIGRVVEGLDKNNLVIEQKRLGIVLASKSLSERELYFELKHIIELLCNINLCDATITPATVSQNFLHPKNAANIVARGKIIGQMGLLHPGVITKIDKKLKMAALEIDFSAFANLPAKEIRVKELSKYQTTTLDFNFVAKKELLYAEIENTLKQFESKLNYRLQLKDVFEEQSTLKGKISYTFTFEIGARDHTLTSAEIEEFSISLVAQATKNGLELR